MENIKTPIDFSDVIDISYLFGRRNPFDFSDVINIKRLFKDEYTEAERKRQYYLNYRFKHHVDKPRKKHKERTNKLPPGEYQRRKNEYNKKYLREHPEKVKELQERYRQKHPGYNYKTCEVCNVTVANMWLHKKSNKHQSKVNNETSI